MSEPRHIITRDGPFCGAPYDRERSPPLYVGPEDAIRHGRGDVCPECVDVVVRRLVAQRAPRP